MGIGRTSRHPPQKRALPVHFVRSGQQAPRSTYKISGRIYLPDPVNNNFLGNITALDS
jgi:hypothetical protein